MPVVHAAIRTAPDYLTRRAPLRQAHLERLLALRSQRVVIGGGPAPDGSSADVFYRVAGTRPEEATALIEADPYYLGGAWTGWDLRGFTQFVDPWEAVPVATDGSRLLTIVEGPTDDPVMAELALVELRGGGRLAFGGLMDGGHTLAVIRAVEFDLARGCLAATGFWTAARLTARPFLYVV